MPVRRMGTSHGGGRASRLWLVIGLVLLVVIGVHDLSTRNRLSELEEAHSNIRKERDTLNSQASQCGTDLHDLTVKQKMCENERADDKRAYTQKVDTLQQQLDALKESDADKVNQISKLESDMKKQASDVEAEKNRLQTDLSECHEQLETARKTAEAQVVEQQDKHEKLQKTHQELQEEFDHIKEQLQLKQAMYDEAHDALQALQAKYDKQTENVEALKKELERSSAQTGGRDGFIESVHLDGSALNKKRKDAAVNEDKHGGFDPELLQARAQDRMKPKLPKPPGPNHSDQDAEAAEKEIAALNDAAHAHQLRRQSAFANDEKEEAEDEQGAEDDRRQQAAAARGAPLRHEVEEGGGIGDGAKQLDRAAARVGQHQRQREPEEAEDYEEEEDAYGEADEEADDDVYGAFADDDTEAQEGGDKAVDMPQDGAAAVVAPHRELVAREGTETGGDTAGDGQPAGMVDHLRQQQEAEDNRGDVAGGGFEPEAQHANDRRGGFAGEEKMQQQHQQQQQQQQAAEWRQDVADAGFQQQPHAEGKQPQAQEEGRPFGARQDDANPRQLLAEDI